jgi:flavin reductase (DIM6/NTAB) family NADH-FMN oxidoreductase RutF
MTRKKPWNRVNLPVYSISSKTDTNQNMHIITYVTAISMQPKRFICGIYHGTQTLENVEKSGEFVLQLLADHQALLVNLLGKQSGKTVPKIQRLEKRKEIVMWNDYPVLKNALALMKMKVLTYMDAGDHKAFLCDVTEYQNMNEGQALTLDHLREKKLIRI